MTKFFKPIATSLLFLCAMHAASAAESSQQGKPVVSMVNAPFSHGDFAQSLPLPSSFGPYKAKTYGIGVYRGRFKVSADDVKERIYVVVRTQQDRSHKLGWVRVFVNNQLVGTEASMRDNRIIEEVTKYVQPGEAQLVVMGTASQDTTFDYYVVPRDSVVKVVQSRPIGVMMATGGPYTASGGKQETFNEHFEVYKPQLAEKIILSFRTKETKTQRFGWVRVMVNGNVVASEQSLKANEATLDITDKLIEGQNKVDVMFAAASGAGLDWFVTQVPKFGPAEREPAIAVQKNAPHVSKMSPSSEVGAGELLQIEASNLDPQAANNIVYFGNIAVAAKSVKNNWLSVDVPKEVLSGLCNVRVAASGAKSNVMQLTVKGYPRVSGTSVAEAAPGREIEIQGENFPDRISQVRVTIGSSNAKVIKADRQRILISVPDLPDNTYAVKVIAGQFSSPDNVSVKVNSAAVEPLNAKVTGQGAEQ